MKDTQGQAPRPRSAANGNGKKPKKRKRVSILIPAILGITAAVVGVCALLSWNLFKNSGNPLFSEYEDIELPNFAGMQIGEVEQLLKKDPYKYLRLEIKEEDNPEVPAGQVISQNPTSSNDNKKMVKANQRIYLIVSRGVVDVEIPDVSGMSQKEAVDKILELGLRPYAQRIEDNSVPTGTVIGTDPAAGSVVQNLPGTVITIKVSSERRNYERTVPNIVDLTLEAAVNVLNGNDLQIGLKTEEFSDKEPGTIIKQSPEAGAVRTIGGTVHVTVSKGPEPPPEPPQVVVPDVKGWESDAALAALAEAGLSPSVTENRVDPAVPAGHVIDQSISPGSSVPQGTGINLAVSAGPDPSSSSSPTPPPDPGPKPDGPTPAPTT